MAIDVIIETLDCPDGILAKYNYGDAYLNLNIEDLNITCNYGNQTIHKGNNRMNRYTAGVGSNFQNGCVFNLTGNVSEPDSSCYDDNTQASMGNYTGATGGSEPDGFGTHIASFFGSILKILLSPITMIVVIALILLVVFLCLQMKKKPTVVLQTPGSNIINGNERKADGENLE